MSFKPITKSKKGKWKGSSGSKYAKFHDEGGWGQRKKVPWKRSIPVVLMLGLFLILSIGNYNGIVQAVPDYNTSYSHTRTNIFTDTSFTGPSTTNSPVFVAQASGQGSATTGTISLVSGNLVLVAVTERDCSCSETATVSDTLGNTYTNLVSAGENSNVFKSTVTTGGSTTITVSGYTQGATQISAVEYSGVTATGASTSSSTSDGASGTNQLTITTVTGSIVYEMGRVGEDNTGVNNCNGTVSDSSLTLRNNVCSTGGAFNIAARLAALDTNLSVPAGPNSFTITWAGWGTAHVEHIVIEIKGNGQPTGQDFSKVQWNFNSTCVKAPGGEFDFTFKTGVKGTGGSNCASADIMVSKAPVNLQTVSGRMFETDFSLRLNSTTPTQFSALDFVLRANNGTLPSFTTNYDPFNDTQARMIWTVCGPNAQSPSLSPVYFPCNFFTTTNNKQGIFIGRDTTKTIFQETLGNDQIITGTALWPSNNNVEEQAVLNFTGPNNYINSIFASTTSNSTQNSASNLQMGQDYYILVKAVFGAGLNGIPDSTNNVAFNNAQSGNLPQAFQMFSVPSSCTDPVNKVTCGLAAAQPVFNFNPLDPSSWGNAIIKGLVWVFLIALPGGLTILIGGFLSVLQGSLNFLGNQVGWGNLGDNTFNFLSNVGSFLLNSTPLGWVATLINESIQEVTGFGIWFGTWVGGLAVAIRDLLFAIPLIGNIVVKIFVFLPTSYILIDLLFWFYYCAEGGLSGMAHWFEWNKWLAFSTYGILEKFVNAFLSLISWLVSRIPSLDGTNLPHLPSIEGGSVPSVTIDLGIPAIRKGDPFAILGFILGSMFSWLWITSASGPVGSSLYLGSVTKYSALSPLLFIFVSFAGLMLIPLLPAYIVKITTGVLDEKKGAIF